MLVRKTRIQLVAFVVISVLAVAYALVRFSDVEKAFGSGGYTVQLQLTESGGIFSGGEVTYRGHNVGEVGQLRLTDSGLTAELDIAADAPPIPRTLDAAVANRSAVGEQYVDLRPTSSGAPYLEDGSVIDASRVSTPVRTEELISDLYDFTESVPTESLRTVVDESYEAFQGTGDDLQALMDTTSEFTRVAREHLPQTVELLDKGSTVLATQNDLSGSLRSFSRDLEALSTTLKNSDGDIRELIDTAPRSATQISQVLAETGPGLSSLVANLLTTANVTSTRLDGIEQAFITYPVVAAGAYSVTPGDGFAHLGMVLNMFDPPSCTKGYRSPEEYRAGNDTSDRPPKNDAYCAEPPGSPISVRGAQNAPYNGVPQIPSDRQVESNSDRDSEQLAMMRGAPGIAGSPGMDITSMRRLLGLDG